MVRNIVELEERRKDALNSYDAVTYFSLCNELGISEHAVEDFGLYERGGLDEGFSRSNGLEMPKISIPNYDVAVVALIALRRFPELESGERISVKEVSNRLREIRAAGYEVGHYSKMNAQELWNYFLELRRAIRRDADDFCSSVLRQIDEDNGRRKREGIEFR